MKVSIIESYFLQIIGSSDPISKKQLVDAFLGTTIYCGLQALVFVCLYLTGLPQPYNSANKMIFVVINRI